MSDSESNCSPKALCVFVSRATRPSMPSSTIAAKIAIAASSNRWFIAWTIAKNPANSAAIVNRFGNR